MTKNKHEKIFIHDFVQTTSNDELEAYIKDNPLLDPTYIVTCCGKERTETKKWLESLWEKYEEYAEPNFLNNLRSKSNRGFHSFSWQMYLATVLLDKGFEIIPNNGVGPDIQIKKGGKNIWIEAVITTSGEDNKIDNSPRSGEIYDSLDPRVARISNSFTKKYKKYKDKYLDKICRKDELFLIAINGAFTDTFQESRAIEATVYGRGNDSFKKNKDGNLKGGFYEKRETIEVKKKGKKVSIPTDYFCTDKYNEVGAVIYCERNIINANNFGRNPEGELFFAKNMYTKNKLGDFVIGNIIERMQDGSIIRRTSSSQSF